MPDAKEIADLAERRLRRIQGVSYSGLPDYLDAPALARFERWLSKERDFLMRNFVFGVKDRAAEALGYDSGKSASDAADYILSSWYKMLLGLYVAHELKRFEHGFQFCATDGLHIGVSWQLPIEEEHGHARNG